MVLKLHFDFLSQPSRALYILLKTCNIPFEPHILKISLGQHQTDEYEKINPFARLPAIEHDGFKLIERYLHNIFSKLLYCQKFCFFIQINNNYLYYSIAIARYLCREFKVPDHWYSTSSIKQAKVDEYLEWQHSNTRLYCSRYFISNVCKLAVLIHSLLFYFLQNL